jgi:hypothetical protein
MPEVFGWEHFLYLAVVIPVMAAGLWWVKRHLRDERRVDMAVKIVGFVLLGAIIWNRLSVAILRSGFNAILPGTFCGTSSMLLSASAIVFKRNHPVFHSIAYTGLLGGLLTLIYPEFIGQAPSVFYPMTISAMVHHTIMVFLVAMMLMTGFLRPELKKWFILPLGLCVYMSYGLFLITVLGYADAMYIHEPILEGTILDWFVLGMMFLAAHALALFVWDRIHKKRSGVSV